MSSQPKKRQLLRGISVVLFLFLASAVVWVVAVITSRSEQHREYTPILDQLADCNPDVEWANGEPTEIYFVDPIANFNLDDHDLALIAKFPTLRVLSIEFAPNISDEGLAYIADLNQLETLVIRFSSLGDASLASLTTLPDLRHLDLYSTDMTDGALAYLAQMPRLRTLDLRRCKITDLGLPVLTELPSLHCLKVTVDGTSVTEGAVQRLRRNRPDLLVSCDPGPNQSFRPDPNSNILGDSHSDARPDWERDESFVLLAEAIDGRTVVQLVCRLDSTQLTGLELNASDAQNRGSSIFAAIRGKLPANLVEWFGERLPDNSRVAPLPAQDLKALLRDGLTVELRVGCRFGDGRTHFRIVR